MCNTYIRNHRGFTNGPSDNSTRLLPIKSSGILLGISYNKRVVMTAQTYAQSQLETTDGKRASWFKDNARARRVTVEMTRAENGDYYVHSAKANYKIGGKTQKVGINNRFFSRELQTSRITTH